VQQCNGYTTAMLSTLISRVTPEVCFGFKALSDRHLTFPLCGLTCADITALKRGAD